MSIDSLTINGRELYYAPTPDTVQIDDGTSGPVFVAVVDIQGVTHLSFGHVTPTRILRFASTGNEAISAADATYLDALFTAGASFGMSESYTDPAGASYAGCRFAARPVFRAATRDGTLRRYDFSIIIPGGNA